MNAAFVALIFPLNVPVVPSTFPVKGPTNAVAVVIPVTKTPLLFVSNLAALTSPVKLPVISPVTFPTKLLAVIIPLVLTEELLSNVVAVSAFPVTSPVIFPITFPV